MEKIVLWRKPHIVKICNCFMTDKNLLSQGLISFNSTCSILKISQLPQNHSVGRMWKWKKCYSILSDLELTEIWHETENCLNQEEKKMFLLEEFLGSAFQQSKTILDMLPWKEQKRFLQVTGAKLNYFYQKNKREKAHLMFFSLRQNHLKVLLLNRTIMLWALPT